MGLFKEKEKVEDSFALSSLVPVKIEIPKLELQTTPILLAANQPGEDMRMLDRAMLKKGITQLEILQKMQDDDRFEELTKTVWPKVFQAAAYFSKEFAKSIEAVEKKNPVKIAFKDLGNREHRVTIDGEKTRFLFNVIGHDLWKIYCESEGLLPDDTLGVAVGGKNIFISKKIASDMTLLTSTGAHELMHLLSNLKHPLLKEGSAERLMYEYVQNSKSVPLEIKCLTAMESGYWEAAAIDYLLEKIVGKEDYLYSHAKGGEWHLAIAFDAVAGKGEFERLFNPKDGQVASETNRKIITELKHILDKHRPEDTSAAIGTVESILREGRYGI